jgi:hypothetical protein
MNVLPCHYIWAIEVQCIDESFHSSCIIGKIQLPILLHLALLVKTCFGILNLQMTSSSKNLAAVFASWLAIPLASTHFE